MKEGGRLFGEDAGNDFDAVIQARVREHFETRMDSATAGIVGAVNESCDAGLDHGAGAHRTGFERDVHRSAGKAVVGEKARSFTQHNDFGVSGGVIVADSAITGLRDDFIFEDEESADRNFSGGSGGAGFVESELHEIEIGGHAKKNSMRRTVA